jgi:hypothetical protein
MWGFIKSWMEKSDFIQCNLYRYSAATVSLITWSQAAASRGSRLPLAVGSFPLQKATRHVHLLYKNNVRTYKTPNSKLLVTGLHSQVYYHSVFTSRWICCKISKSAFSPAFAYLSSTQPVKDCRRNQNSKIYLRYNITHSSPNCWNIRIQSKKFKAWHHTALRIIVSSLLWY